MTKFFKVSKGTVALRLAIFMVALGLVTASMAISLWPQADADVVTAASVDYFLKIDGIDGESRDKDHKNWIDVLSWSWGASNAGTTAGGGGAGAGRAQFSPIIINKRIDKSSPKLMETLARGEQLANLTLDVPRPGKKGEYMKIMLENILVSSVQQEGTASNPPSETISLNYEKIKFFVVDERTGEVAEFNWDTAENQ